MSEILDHGPDSGAAIASEAHAATVADVLATLGTTSAGLSEAEAERRLRRFGPNTIAARPRASALRIALHQFQSPVIYLLLAAGALALYFGETEEALAIGAVLCLNALIATVRRSLQANYPGVLLNKADTVSAKVSGELIRNGVLAVVLAVLGIALWGIVRFEWQFGVSTFVAIMHDVLVTLGFFAFTRLEFDLNIVAAVLTIIGYSINDKIVIDDRIRENMRRYRKMEMREIVNLSVNETLPRTVMTSLTMILALGSMLILGPAVIFGFTAAMLLGIVVGTYSSIYVSSSLLIALGINAATFKAAPAGGAAGKAERVGR